MRSPEGRITTIAGTLTLLPGTGRRCQREAMVARASTASVSANCSPMQYEIYGELMTWFFVYDDWAEQLGHYLSPEEVSALTDTVSTWFAEDEQDVQPRTRPPSSVPAA